MKASETAAQPDHVTQQQPTLRVMAFFDGQNVLRSANDAFGWNKKQWDYDPRKLFEIAKTSIEKDAGQIDAGEIRFYTGVPTHERDKLGRNYWERLFTRFRNDKIVVTSRNLKYNEVGVAREKGIDLRIGLDLLRKVVDADCDVVVLFSQDTDLREAVIEAKIMLAREKQLTGKSRFVSFFCVFPATVDDTTYHGIPGMTWVPLYPEDFRAAVYTAPPRKDLEQIILELEQRLRKRRIDQYDIVAGGKAVIGNLLGCHTSESKSIIIIEQTADLLILHVHPECVELFKEHTGARVRVAWKSGARSQLTVEITPT